MNGPANLAYLVIQASDIDAWEDFAVNIVGFQVGSRSPDRLTLRMDRAPQRFIVERGGDDDVVASGWLFDSIEQLESHVDHLRSCGHVVTQGDDALLASRCVNALVYVEGPNGIRHEFVANPVVAQGHDVFASKVMEGKFVAGRFGLGHYVEIARDYRSTYKFLKDVVNLKVSGFIRSEELGNVDIAFFHANTGRYHAIATAQLPFPKRCFHIGMEVDDFNDVGRAFDRAAAAGIIEQNFGYHPNAQTTSFYFRTPSGFWMELGYGELVIDDSDWQIETHHETSAWGHKPYPAAAE